MDDFKKIAPKLSKITKESPFKVPDTYFDDFSARLREKIEAEKRVLPEPKNRIIQFLKPAISLAASFALIFLLVYWPLKTSEPDKMADNSNTQNELYDEDYYSLLENNIDEYSLYAWMNEPAPTEEISDEDLISYLSTNISEYDIYNMDKNF